MWSAHLGRVYGGPRRLQLAVAVVTNALPLFLASADIQSPEAVKKSL